jgi:hypothetical protein
METEREVGTALAGTPASGALDLLLVGPTVYEGPTAFIDIVRLLRTVEGEALTGHVLVTGPGFSALVLLVGGRILAARFGDGRLGPVTEVDGALRCLEWRAARGDGRVTVVGLDADRAEAAAELLTGRLLVGGLRGRFADLDALLDYLGEVALDGTLVVEAAGRTAVVLFSAGRVRRAFWGTRTVAGRVPPSVRALTAGPDARLEVTVDERWVPGSGPAAAVPSLVLQGRSAAAGQRRRPRAAAGGSAG